MSNFKPSKCPKCCGYGNYWTPTSSAAMTCHECGGSGVLYPAGWHDSNRIKSLQTELASYMESDANLRKRVQELEERVKQYEAEYELDMEQAMEQEND